MDRSKPFLAASALALYGHFALQLVAGALLATVYRADPSAAHATTAQLHQGVWRFLQGFHYWGSAVLIVQSALHFAGVTWAGWYRSQTRAYFAALALAALALGFQISGNALPWDRHGVQTAGVEGAIAARVPVVGPGISRLMLGGDAGPQTLGVWWTAHWILLPLALVVAVVVGLALPRRTGARWPLFVPAALALLLALVLPSPFGSAASAGDYGRFDAKPSWYTIPMHGLLVWGDRLVPGGGWIGAALVPALLGLALVALPFLKRKGTGLGRAVLLGFGGLGLVAALTAGGEFAPLTGTRDPRALPTVATGKPTGVQDKALALKGSTLFAAQGCNGCHGENGLKGTGGPSLKDVGREHPDADYYVRYVSNPQSVDKGSTMPAYPNLKADELRSIAEFLRFPR